MKNRFTQKAEHALEGALIAAREMGHTYIGSEHLLLALALEPESVSAKLMQARGISAEQLRTAIEDASGLGSPTRITPAEMTPRTRKIIESAAAEAQQSGVGYIGTEHLLLAILTERDSAALRILNLLRVNVQELQGEIRSFFNGRLPAPDTEKAGENDKKGGKRNSELSAAPALRNFGRDLTALAREGRLDPVIGRKTETERVIQTLSRRTKNNPCLIGEPGVGKTAVIEGLAQMIADGNVPEQLRDKLIITLDIPAMVAGAKYRGEFEERLKNVMEEVARNPRIILFVDEIHTIIGAGGAEGAIDAANIIKPALARGEMQLIGATTITEYRRHIEKDAALERRFQSVTVGEPTEKEALQILRGLRERFSVHHGLHITDEALEAAVGLSVRYLPDRFLPDKAIDLIDEAAAHQRVLTFSMPPVLREMEEHRRQLIQEKEEAITRQDFEQAARLRDEELRCTEAYQQAKTDWELGGASKKKSVTAEHIAQIVTQQTSIPLNRLMEEESARLLALEDTLRARVIGQEDAIAAVARAIRRGRVGIKDPRRPIGSFLFLGQSGVGKTELSRALAEVLFGSTSAMIRLDMSEYMEKHSVSKLIGSPPGYVGYEEGGRLTEQVRRRPYAVLLFDEIEKAHPDIFNLLLQILEDGRLTDAQGRRVDFRNTVIILTSNLGSDPRDNREPAGFGASSEKKADDPRESNALRGAFRPEFINRIDDIIRFAPLDPPALRRITRLLLEDLTRRVAAQGITLDFAEDAVDWLAGKGSGTRFGARPLRRAIVRYVENRLAMAMLTEEIQTGDRLTVSLAPERTGDEDALLLHVDSRPLTPMLPH